jgi:hypothetical protein
MHGHSTVTYTKNLKNTIKNPEFPIGFKRRKFAMEILQLVAEIINVMEYVSGC